MTTELVCKPLAQIITFWRPGSAEWSWADEYADLIDDDVTQRIEERINAEGIGFVDHITPVLLGSDGRVWDGHHRIVLAIKRGVPALMCEVAGADVIECRFDHAQRCCRVHRTHVEPHRGCILR